MLKVLHSSVWPLNSMAKDDLELDLDFGSSGLHLPCDRITGIYHYSGFMGAGV